MAKFKRIRMGGGPGSPKGYFAYFDSEEIEVREQTDFGLCVLVDGGDWVPDEARLEAAEELLRRYPDPMRWHELKRWAELSLREAQRLVRSKKRQEKPSDV
jgi:hypothetical protein